MASSFWKVCGFTGHTKREGCVFGFFHPETRFQKSAFSGAVLSASVWTVDQNDASRVCFRKRAFSCGRPLKHCLLHVFLCDYHTLIRASPLCGQGSAKGEMSLSLFTSLWVLGKRVMCLVSCLSLFATLQVLALFTLSPRLSLNLSTCTQSDTYKLSHEWPVGDLWLMTSLWHLMLEHSVTSTSKRLCRPSWLSFHTTTILAFFLCLWHTHTHTHTHTLHASL